MFLYSNLAFLPLILWRAKMNVQRYPGKVLFVIVKIESCLNGRL